MDDIPEYADTSYDMTPCNICGRTFLPDSLARHERICEKSQNKKRKVFNSAKQRAEGTDISSVPRTEVKLPPSKKNNWRRKHEDFIEAMRSAKGVSHAIKTGAPLPPPPSQKRVNPDYVQCPSCERHFSETAAERHISFCKEKNKRMDKRTPSAADKNKLNARTQYKPPLPGSKKKQASPASRTPQSRARSQRGTGDDMSDLESRMNGGMKIGNRTTARNKSYTGSKARSASLERPSPKATSNSMSRSSSGDSVRGRRQEPSYNGRNYHSGDNRYTEPYDDYDDYGYNEDYPDSRRGSAGRKLQPISKNHTLPHNRLKALSDDSEFALSSSRTPTPPSSRPSSNSSSRRTSADVINGRKLPKFCHECGTKYPVSNAKFCCECGTRRAYLD
ncbi:zinc finger C2HC domain-containing protein 1A-like [Diadema setosum]|uniref:zinc finger C2HC domain-containing protein 1A-like n=1 Tax=Diadema setosum TaxID=31175 RepID=UPI003B3A7AB0